MSGCAHSNRVEWGLYALCFDCGAERGRAVAPVPAPSIVEQHLTRVSERVLGPAPSSGGVGVPCAGCGARLGSLHALIAHRRSECAVRPVVAG